MLKLTTFTAPTLPHRANYTSPIPPNVHVHVSGSPHLFPPTAYVDDHLVGTGKVSKAAIIGKQGGVWAATSGYNVSVDFIRGR